MDLDPQALARRRWPMLEQDAPLVLVPVGSLEQHGPHLPLNTDTLIATWLVRETARRLAERGTDVAHAPALAYGASGEHEDFPGTVSIGHEALFSLLVEHGRSACRWARGLVLVNGHGGNQETLVRAVRRLREEGRPVSWTSCAVPGGDAHAGRTETSMMAWIAPQEVRTDLAVDGVPDEAADPAGLARLMPRLRAEGVRAVSPSGVLGAATLASDREGKELAEALVVSLVAELADLDRVGDDGRLLGATDDRAGPSR